MPCRGTSDLEEKNIQEYLCEFFSRYPLVKEDPLPLDLLTLTPKQEDELREIQSKPIRSSSKKRYTKEYLSQLICRACRAEKAGEDNVLRIHSCKFGYHHGEKFRWRICGMYLRKLLVNKTASMLAEIRHVLDEERLDIVNLKDRILSDLRDYHENDRYRLDQDVLSGHREEIRTMDLEISALDAECVQCQVVIDGKRDVVLRVRDEYYEVIKRYSKRENRRKETQRQCPFVPLVVTDTWWTEDVYVKMLKKGRDLLNRYSYVINIPANSDLVQDMAAYMINLVSFFIQCVRFTKRGMVARQCVEHLVVGKTPKEHVVERYQYLAKEWDLVSSELKDIFLNNMAYVKAAGRWDFFQTHLDALSKRKKQYPSSPKARSPYKKQFLL